MTDSICILIKTLSGNTIVADVEKTDTVAKMKIIIQDKEGVAPSEQRLIFGGKQLEDDMMISYYNLEHGSTVHLVLRLRGGMNNRIERNNIILSIERKFKNMCKHNGMFLEKDIHDLSFMTNFRRICNKYVEQNEHNIISYNGVLDFNEINRKIYYILPARKNDNILFIIR